MLYAIHKGQVAGCSTEQKDIVYLCSDTENVRDAGMGFVFTDGHGTMALTQFFQDLRQISRIDWEIMRAVYWRDTQEDGDRKRRRQAEFLVHSFFPWSLVQRIVVLQRSQVGAISKMCEAAGLPTSVVAMPAWYY